MRLRLFAPLRAKVTSSALVDLCWLLQTSFDHLVGAGQQRRRHFERQRPGSAEINHQLELRWQLNRQVARFFALENATCIDAYDPIGLVGIRSIAHQPPDGGKFTAEVEGSHPMPCRKHDDLRRTIEKKRIDSNGKGIDALLPEGCERRIDLGNGTRVEDYDLPPDIGSRGPNVVQLSIDIRHIRIDENADGRCIGSQLTQEPEPLRLQLSLKPAVAGAIAAGPMQVGNQPAADWIRCDGKDHG